MEEQDLAPGEPASKKWPDCCNDCNHEWQSKELTPDSNELLNIFLMILGGLSVLYGIVLYFPDLLPFLSGITTNPDFQMMVGVFGSSNIILGGFAFIAGVGMFKEQEWAWGMSLMVLTFILANTLTTLISTGFAFSFGLIIQIISIACSVIGIPWLLATKARYY